MRRRGFPRVAFQLGVLGLLSAFPEGCQKATVGSSGGDSTVMAGIPWKVIEYLQSIPPLRSVADTVLASGLVRIEILAADGAGEKPGQHSYYYTVINKQGSFGSVTEFGLRNMAKEPEGWEAPEHWRGVYVPGGDSAEFRWSLIDSAGRFGIEPGDTLFGFELVSLSAPRALGYRAIVRTKEAGEERFGEVWGVIEGPQAREAKRR